MAYTANLCIDLSAKDKATDRDMAASPGHFDLKRAGTNEETATEESEEKTLAGQLKHWVRLASLHRR